MHTAVNRGVIGSSPIASVMPREGLRGILNTIPRLLAGVTIIAKTKFKKLAAHDGSGAVQEKGD